MPSCNSAAEANYSVSGLMIMQKKYGEAEQHTREAIKLDPQYGEAWFQLGHILLSTNRLAESEAAFRHSMSLLPDSIDPVLGLAHTLRARGNSEEAMPLFQRARSFYQSITDTQADNANAHRILGEICMIDSDFAAAEAEFRTVLEFEPNNLEILLKLADALFFQSKVQGMNIIAERAHRLDPDNEWTNIKMAESLHLAAKPEQAFGYIDRALAVNPRNTRAITLSALLLERLGEPRKGYERLLPLIEQGNAEDANIILTFSALAQHSGKYDEAISMLRNKLEGGAIANNAVRLMLHFSLGDLYDMCESYDEAFVQYQSANQLKQVNFDRQNFGEYIDSMETTFTRDFLERVPHAIKRTELPVFVVGMPRSGTTLVETILASHPDIHGAGELGYITEISLSLGRLLGNELAFPDSTHDMTVDAANGIAAEYLNALRDLAGDARRAVDKFPSNFLYLGLIQILFPGARVIHCRRDPLDTCLSIYFKNFVGAHPYAYDLEDLGFFYNKYRHLMEHWRRVLSIPVLEVDYENLVNNQEAITRQLVSFCGLEWHNDCLRFHEHERFAATASYDQVRQPMYKTSVKRWKNYEKHIQPLVRALDIESSPAGRH
jgi:tetratricopeptide (TPR) repeat protein